MENKLQVCYIHGGMTFKNRKAYIHYLKTRDVPLKKKAKWHGAYLEKKLGKRFDILRPSMPLADNAHYDEWKIHFERLIPSLRKNIIFVGSSLGGIFLAKYLSENTFPKKILSLYLIAAPYDNTVKGEDLVGGFSLKLNLSLLEKNSKTIHLLFSRDEPVVPVSHAFKYKKKLKSARLALYKSKNGHFKVPTFPELVRMIKQDAQAR